MAQVYEPTVAGRGLVGVVYTIGVTKTNDVGGRIDSDYMSVGPQGRLGHFRDLAPLRPED